MLKLSNIGQAIIGSQLRPEDGRWNDTSLNERKCNICNKSDIGNEYHYFHVTFLKSERKLYLKPYFYVNPNICKYKELFTSTSEKTLIKLSKFVGIIMQKFSTWVYFLKEFET